MLNPPPAARNLFALQQPVTDEEHRARPARVSGTEPSFRGRRRSLDEDFRRPGAGSGTFVYCWLVAASLVCW